MNHFVGIGRVAQEPEMRYSEKGMCITRFSLAIRKNKTEADFINIVTFDKVAENCSAYLKKGDKVAVSGSVNVSSYEKEGKKVYKTEINARSVEFLEDKKDTKKSTEIDRMNEALPF